LEEERIYWNDGIMKNTLMADLAKIVMGLLCMPFINRMLWFYY